MGILSRFSDIMKSNINDLLDRAEDPAKMADQYLRDSREELAKVKKETAGVMANEKAAKRAVDECQAEIDRFSSAAMAAVKAGNDDDARKLLAHKQAAEEKLVGLQQNYAVAAENSRKMKDLYDKLTSDIASLESRRDTVKAKMATAKAQQTVNKFSNAGERSDEILGAFDRMEQKADRMLDTAESTAELQKGMEDDAETIAQKYSKGSSTSVEDELAALKAALANDEG